MIMKNKEIKKSNHHRLHGVGFAVTLIAAGLIVFAHKLGYIDHHPYRILISWQMLLVVCGLWSFVTRQWKQGVVLMGVGGFFMIPLITEAGRGWAATYWPLLLVLAGLLFIVEMLTKRRCKESSCDSCFCETTTHETENGFVNTNTCFSGVKNIVLDPVFKGGQLKNCFGGTILDLRNTTIAEGETYIDIHCVFGGVELYMPHNWTLVCDVEPTFGGVEDKRFMNKGEIDTSRKLVLRGRLVFGGVVIKN